MTSSPGFTVHADDRTRAEARRAAAGPQIRGGIAIGRWLRLAHEIFGSCPAVLRHAVLLTDGQNAGEPGQVMLAARVSLVSCAPGERRGRDGARHPVGQDGPGRDGCPGGTPVRSK
jgi:hypothetical protein